jgi:predicted RNase H-like nuclease (RuvC/YqgF family)
MCKSFWAGTALLALAWPLCVVAQQAPPPQKPPKESLAEAARKAREAKKNKPETAKVFTNDNIDSVHGNVNVVGPEPTPPTKEDAKPGDKTPDAAAKDRQPKEEKGEAYWRKKFADANRKLQMAEKELDILQRELSLLQTQYYSDPNKALSEQYDRKEINDKQKKIDEKKQDVEQLRQGISDLETDLRHAGGDPGWARQP